VSCQFCSPRQWPGGTYQGWLTFKDAPICIVAEEKDRSMIIEACEVLLAASHKAGYGNGGRSQAGSHRGGGWTPHQCQRGTEIRKMKEFVVIYNSNTGKAEVQEFDSFDAAVKAYKEAADRLMCEPGIQVNLIGGAKDRADLENSWRRFFMNK